MSPVLTDAPTCITVFLILTRLAVEELLHQSFSKAYANVKNFIFIFNYR